MEKKCDCECHKLHPIPCMYCTARHDEHDHDGKTEPNLPAAKLVTDEEGFPF